jgi:hypothetical protein
MTTTSRNYGGLIFPNLACDQHIDEPNQPWVADIIYVAITAGLY